MKTIGTFRCLFVRKENKTMKRWKVVTKDRRSYPGKIMKVHYRQGETIHFDLLGGFVFEHEYDAKKYVKYCATPKLKIIEVEAIGRGKHIVSCPIDILDISAYSKNLKKITTHVKDIYNRFAYPGESIGTKISNNKYLSIWICAEGSMVYPTLKILT